MFARCTMIVVFLHMCRACLSRADEPQSQEPTPNAPSPEFQASVRYPMVFDPLGTSLMGARDMSSLVRGVNRALDLTFGTIPPLHWSAEVSIRLGRFLLLDAPISMLSIWTQHELFGHATRGREFGLNPVVHLAVPPPYGFDVYSVGVSYSAGQAAQLEFDQKVLLKAEGQESEELFVREMVKQCLVAKRWERIVDSVIMVRAMGDVSRIEIHPADGSNYERLVRSGRESWHFAPMRLGYLRWGLDPLFWWSLYDYFYLGMIKGEPATIPPTWSWGKAEILPQPRLRWSPWGEDIGINTLFIFPEAFSEMELLFGPRDGFPSLSFQGTATFVELVSWVELGGTLAAWLQPQNHYQDVSIGSPFPIIFEVPTLQVGGLLELETTFRIFDWGHLVAMVGVKSYGYAVGRPLDAGFYFQSGIMLTL